MSAERFQDPSEALTGETGPPVAPPPAPPPRAIAPHPVPAAPRPRGWWVLTTVAPFGFLAPAGFGYAAWRAQKPSWYLWGVAWGLLTFGALAVNVPAAEDSDVDGFTSLMMMIAWIGALVHALAIRGEYVRRVVAARHGPAAAARERLRQRLRAQELAAGDPALAREMGVGRPDVPGAEHMGVVDINHAHIDWIARLPGMNADAAAQIVAARSSIRGFSSAEDLGQVLDLDPALVDALRAHTVYIPR